VSPATGRRRRVAGAAHLLLGIVAAGVVAACTGEAAPRIVDGWLIGPQVSCTDLGFDDTDCQQIAEAADAVAARPGEAAASWTIHEAAAVDALGSPRLLELGSGVPDGILLVRRPDGSEEVALIGCFQEISPRNPPACP
jgi:hypothetical protein